MGGVGGSVEVWGRGRVSRDGKAKRSTQANAAHRRQCCKGEGLHIKAGCSIPTLFILFIPALVWSPASREPMTARAVVAAPAAAGPPVAAPAVAAPAAAPAARPACSSAAAAPACSPAAVAPAACAAFQQQIGAALLRRQAAFVDAGGPWQRQPVKRWLCSGRVRTGLCECETLKPWPLFVRCKAIISSCRAVLCPNLIPASPEDIALLRMAFSLVSHLPHMWHLPAPPGPLRPSPCLIPCLTPHLA